MTLWRVDVGAISHRFVEADSRAEAIETVRQSLVDALDVVATQAPREVRMTFAELGPRQRKRLLAALDGLAGPTVGRGKGARRALARQIRFDMEEQAWLRKSAPTQRPVDPEALATLMRHVEANSLRRVRSRLREFERRYYEDEEVHGSSLRRQ